MHFQLIDEVVELTAERAVAVKYVGADEPSLSDHFPTFPILPGVLMLEAMVQAARRVLAVTDAGADRHVLCGVRALKYGAMVKPGMRLRVTVELEGRGEDGSCEFKGQGRAIAAGASEEESANAVSGRFTLRPSRVEAPRVTG